MVRNNKKIQKHHSIKNKYLLKANLLLKKKKQKKKNNHNLLKKNLKKKNFTKTSQNSKKSYKN